VKRALEGFAGPLGRRGIGEAEPPDPRDSSGAPAPQALPPLEE